MNVLQAQVKTSGHIHDKDVFKRKQDGILSEIQNADKQRQEQHHLTCKLRLQKKTTFETERAQRDQENEEARDLAHLRSLAHQKKRYSERMSMYNMIGGSQVQSTQNLFGVHAM